MNKHMPSPQRQREYALYRYHKALEGGDIETVAVILKQAEDDAMLNEMIAELDSLLESESEVQTRPSDAPLISLPPSLNGQPPKPNHFQEQTDMTTQTRYWEPTQSAGRANRLAVVMIALVAMLVIGILFLYLIPSANSIQTLVVQQPTQTPAEIAKLYVEELWGKGNKDIAKTLLAVNFVDHDPMFVNNSRLPTAKDTNNSAVFNYNIEVLHTGFPDLAVKTEAIVEGSNQVVVRWTFTGTHSQPFLTLQPTAKSVTITNTDILRIVDGQIVERWGANQLQSLTDVTGIVNVPVPAVEAVTAFARFAYLYSTNQTDKFGDALSDDIVLNGEVSGLKAVEEGARLTSEQSGGLTNIKMISATVNGNHLVGTIEFYTSNGTKLNRGTVRLTIKDGKIISYDYADGG